MVFFALLFFCCRDFWMEYLFVDFSMLYIYIYVYTPMILGGSYPFPKILGHQRRRFFHVLSQRKWPVQKMQLVWYSRTPSLPTCLFKLLQGVPPKNMSFSCLYKDKSHVRLYHTALKRCKRCNWPSLCPRPLLERWGITRVVDLSRKHWALGDNRSGLSR